MVLPYDHRMAQPMIKTTAIAALTLAALATEASAQSRAFFTEVIE